MSGHQGPTSCLFRLPAITVAFRFRKAAEGCLLGICEALRVDTQENKDAVACPLGDLSGRYACIKPGG
jgi:hypothetical protein